MTTLRKLFYFLDPNNDTAEGAETVYKNELSKKGDKYESVDYVDLLSSIW
jgi:hypothetical protein